MQSKVAQIFDHWKVTMGYTIEISLAKEIIKSLNSKIQGKSFETNFFRTLLNNRSECRKQVLEEKQKISADNDITLWLAVLDYTISTFEDQLDFAAGSGKPPRPSSETRTLNKEKSVNAIAPSTSHPNKLKRKDKENEKSKPVKSNTKKTVSFEDTNTSGMTCFKCGKVGE